MIYDLAIVGAGPAGLMAAKTAAEKGLKVALIEKKSNVSTVTGSGWNALISSKKFKVKNSP